MLGVLDVLPVGRAAAVDDDVPQGREGVVGGFLLVAAVLGLVVLKFRRDLRREDEARARKYGRKA